ncbi:MAG: 5-methylcytosine-specific restriction enzyme, partial [Myxococcales bacterium]|nr:5-methylcytosine-specific restriction enzyme [Myxococcales bacterium]
MRDATPARVRLDEVLTRAEGSLAAPSGATLKELQLLVESWTGIKPVYASTISKPGNFSVRFEQSKRAKAGKLKVAVLPESADVEDTLEKGRVWAERDPGVRAFVYCAKVGGMWDLVAVHERASGVVTQKLTSPDMFPEARQLSVGTPKELLSAEECQELADELYLDRSWVDDLAWMLNDKRAIVLYGPPGTGKTWLSQRLASQVQPDPTRRRLVQLHPSYGYEEFFEGYRPSET